MAADSRLDLTVQADVTKSKDLLFFHVFAKAFKNGSIVTDKVHGPGQFTRCLFVTAVGAQIVPTFVRHRQQELNVIINFLALLNGHLLCGAKAWRCERG